MESTLFTTLNANEEANISGGTSKKKKAALALLFATTNTAKADVKQTNTSTVTNNVTGGKVNVDIGDIIGKKIGVNLTINNNTTVTTNTTQTNTSKLNNEAG